MGFFKDESKRLAKESIKCLDNEIGQVTSLLDLEEKYPAFYKDWEGWDYDAENEEVTAVGSFGIYDVCDRLLTLKVQPIDDDYFIIYGAKVEENIN